MSFHTLKTTRENILRAIQDFSPTQLNHIPNGFNNNLVWNLGHVIVTQQLLCYGRSGLDFKIDATLIDQYRKGTKPEGFISAEHIDQLKSLAMSTVDQMQEDFENEVFTQYEPYSTSYGVTLDSIDKAIAFNNVHEGMHLGYILALRKLI